MSYQDLNVTLSDADRQAIKQAIATIQQKLPFLITLSADERKRLYKMGDKRLAFVQNSLNVAQSNRNILPAASTSTVSATTTSSAPTSPNS